MILQLTSIMLYLIMLVVVIYSIGKYKNMNDLLKKMGFRETNLKKDVLVGIFYVGLLIITAMAVSSIFLIFGQQQDVSKVSNILQQVDISEILIVLGIGSFVEEIFFRGYLQRKTNILFASFIFGYFHIIYGSWSEVVGAFFLGIVLGVCFKRTKNLFVSTFAHFAYNIFTIAFLFL